MLSVDFQTYDAESTDVATRVTLSTTSETPIVIRLGDGDDGFIAGDFIEFVNEGPATVSFDVKGFTTDVIMDQGTAPPVLMPQHRAVAYYRGPDEYRWDIVSHQGNNQTATFVFQVGVQLGGHIHLVKMTLQQVQDLVQDTSSDLPVADPSQPSVVIKAYPNSNPGNELHTHDLTVYFDYVNHTLLVTDISNNVADSHQAFLIGTAGGGSGGVTALEFLDDVDFGSYPPNDRDVLVYNAANQVWEPVAQQGLPYDLKGRPMEVFNSIGAFVVFGNSRHHNSSWRATSANPVVVSVPLDSAWGFDVWWENNGFPQNPGPMPDGGSAVFGKHGAGNVTFVPEPGVTINTPDTLTISRLHGKATLIKVGPNEWDLEGNVGT